MISAKLSTETTGLIDFCGLELYLTRLASIALGYPLQVEYTGNSSPFMTYKQWLHFRQVPSQKLFGLHFALGGEEELESYRRLARLACGLLDYGDGNKLSVKILPGFGQVTPLQQHCFVMHRVDRVRRYLGKLFYSEIDSRPMQLDPDLAVLNRQLDQCLPSEGNRISAQLSLGAIQIPFEDLLNLHPGSIVEFESDGCFEAEIVCGAERYAGGQLEYVDGRARLKISYLEQSSVRMSGIKLKRERGLL